MRIAERGIAVCQGRPILLVSIGRIWLMLGKVHQYGGYQEGELEYRGLHRLEGICEKKKRRRIAVGIVGRWMFVLRAGGRGGSGGTEGASL